MAGLHETATDVLLLLLFFRRKIKKKEVCRRPDGSLTPLQIKKRKKEYVIEKIQLDGAQNSGLGGQGGRGGPSGRGGLGGQDGLETDQSEGRIRPIRRGQIE